MSVSILGTGVAFPAQQITNEFLEALNISTSNSWGVSSRYTVLPLNYIEETKNSDCFQINDLDCETPTDLLEKAALAAIESANIKTDDIGLILGDTCTPLETTPSEAQRLGKRLQLKIPAYDVSNLSCSLLCFIEMLLGWKDDQVPDYVLFVSGNSPTRLVSYDSNSNAAAILGDGAGACVVSTREMGKLEILDYQYKINEELSKCFNIPTMSNLSILEEQINQSLSKDSAWASSYFSEKGLSEVFVNPASSGLLDNGKLLEASAQAGDLIGAASFLSIHTILQAYDTSKEFGLTLAGAGSMLGLLSCKLST